MLNIFERPMSNVQRPISNEFNSPPVLGGTSRVLPRGGVPAGRGGCLFCPFGLFGPFGP